MREDFATKKGFAFAITLVALAATGSLPALAQSVSAFGSPLATHYNGSGEREAGWNAETPSVRHLARAEPANKSGLNAFAQAPSTILPAAPFISTVPSSLGLTDRFGAGSQS
jgi:hypothetical protein